MANVQGSYIKYSHLDNSELPAFKTSFRNSQRTYLPMYFMSLNKQISEAYFKHLTKMF